MKRSTLNLILALPLIFVTYSYVVRADCTVNGTPGLDGTSGDDTIVCDSTSTATSNDGVGGNAGSDTIIIEIGATVPGVAGDGRSFVDGMLSGDNGSAAPDTIIIAGTADSVYGDLVNDLGGADDHITVTSTGHVASIAGDSAGAVAIPVSPQVGDDTIIIEAGAVVDYDVSGDNLFGIQESATGGNDNITVNGTVGRNVEGQVGNDTITVGGTVGGVVDGGLGDDNITVNGTVGNVLGQEGNDTITVSGTVNGMVDGGSGDDNITVSGTVGNVQGQASNDTITVSGTVNGSINGGSGDDQVTLNDGANGGADSNLAVNGGDGNDTLTFAFTISSQEDYDALAALIAGNSSSGSITINGQTITWSNFEQLINALIANFGVGTQVTFKDNRVNSTDAGASALAYCTGSGVQVLRVDSVTAQGNEAFTVSTAQIQAALAEAQSSSTNVEITSEAGITLSITPDGKLVVTAPDIGDASKTYQFSFDAGVCGIG